MRYSIFKKYLEEKAVTFGGKMYPKFNQVVILAGGAGSGKGFVLNNLLGIEGIVYDVDRLKELSLESKHIQEYVLEKTGHDITKFDLRNPKDVSNLHAIMKKIDLPNRKLSQISKAVLNAHPERRPNIIIDMTMKDVYSFHKFTDLFRIYGYSPENIHLVWILNDVEVAKEQNQKRARRVPEKILLGTHSGAKKTFMEILRMGKRLRNYVDGDIYIVFNKKFVDSILKTSGKGGKYISKANYIKVKAKGQRPIDMKRLSERFLKKIEAYTPKV